MKADQTGVISHEVRSGTRPDRNLALELVRVTEAVALAAARWVGRGEKEAADQAAVDADDGTLDVRDDRTDLPVGLVDPLANGRELGILPGELARIHRDAVLEEVDASPVGVFAQSESARADSDPAQS